MLVAPSTTILAPRRHRLPARALSVLCAIALVAVSVRLAYPTGSRVVEARPRARLLVIGLDGATWDVIQPLLDQGRMPNLKRLIATGVSGPLRSVYPPSSPPAWTSAVTGVNPGKHGVFGFTRGRSRSGSVEFVSAQDRRHVPVWTLLSRAQRKVGVINVPVTSPPDAVNGFMVGGFPHTEKQAVAYPPDLLQQFPDYRLDVFSDAPAAGAEAPWLRQLNAVLAARLGLAHRMLEQGGYDLFFVVITATDRVQHFFWKHSDPHHPGHDPARSPQFSGAIAAVHGAADAAIGDLVTLSGPGTTTIVLSDHGFGPLYYGISADELIAQVNAGHENEFRLQLSDYFGGALRVTPGPAVPRTPEKIAAIDSTVAAGLRRLYDPVRGLPLVASVHKRADVYQGEAVREAPEVLFLETEGYLVTRYQLGGLTGELPDDFFSGHHRMNGVLVMNGPGLRSGQHLAVASILDIAPTILYLLGQPVPRYMDGQALTHAVDPVLLGRFPLRTVAMPAGDYLENRAPGRENQSGVEDQLRSLGYLQ